MSSGYSSLEEDSEDFFFTARTSFFRRAPQGKPRAGQQVSGTRRGRRSPRPPLPGSLNPRVPARLAGDAGWEGGGGGREGAPALWDPKVVPGARAHGRADVRARRAARTRERGGRAGDRGPSPAFRARWPLRPSFGLRASSSERGGVPRPSRRFLCAPAVRGRVLAPALTVSRLSGH